MKHIILLLILFFTFSCVTIPQSDLTTDESKIWINKVKNKYSIDPLENVYRFKNNGDIDIFIYGYKEPIKYILYKVENNIAFYYRILSVKNFVINNIPAFNLYNLDVVNNTYDLLDKQIDFASIKNFKDKDISIITAFEVRDNDLYIIVAKNENYTNKVNMWRENNGYIGMNTNWRPYNNANWYEYPLPTAEDLNLNVKYKINKLYDM